jgi:uncharacterized membrane protein YjgN (DUF898 family)
MSKSQNFKFHGGPSSYLGVGILSTLLTIFTLGIGFPWAYCMQQQWRVNNTSVSGRRLRFSGSGLHLFGLWIKWYFLSLITAGIYLLWVGPALERWKVEHTDFE